MEDPVNLVTIQEVLCRQEQVPTFHEEPVPYSRSVDDLFKRNPALVITPVSELASCHFVFVQVNRQMSNHLFLPYFLVLVSFVPERG
jgi:hypothetical protein